VPVGRIIVEDLRDGRKRRNAVPECGRGTEETEGLERRTLRILLGINAGMFIVEVLAGWRGESTGLLADSLDMLSDASVYGAALYAVGRSRRLQAGVAAASGVIQVLLGVGVLVQVFLRFLYGSEPMSLLMMTVGALALIANVSCMMLIAGHRRGGVHMRASWICSINDVAANAGVIASGGLVKALGNRFPDLIIGAAISAIVLRGGIKMLQEARREPIQISEPPK
jgi:Co/Zn/Cd efflux system component